ncbi:MAG: hypothetical protein GY799_12215 [Desulfobulbaceae bacterium]|nr:hypothetical protein [Desulfobulbaceae bacterium]
MKKGERKRLPKIEAEVAETQENNFYQNFHNWKTTTGNLRATKSDFIRALCCHSPSENFSVVGEGE